MTTNTQIIKAVFTPTLLYQNENWTLTSKERQMLTTTDTRCLRKAAGNTKLDKIRSEEIRRLVNMQPAEQKQTRTRSGGGHTSKGWYPGSPEQSTRDPSRRMTTEGKATKSLGRLCTEMVQGDGNPDDSREQLGQGETSDCLSTRCQWQNISTTKVSK